MRVLIIGGTIFLGRRLVEAALARRHEVATFTRGCHRAAFGGRVEELRGDRGSDVSALRSRAWDAVIDTCGYVPSGVTRVMDALDRERTGHYTFISSVSAYASFPLRGTDETAPVATITPEELTVAEAAATGVRPTARTYGDMYGALKVLCERAAEERMPGRVLTVRPGLIVGAYDYSDRFTYWVRRVSKGGDVLAPGRPDRRVRVIDARDLAGWIIRMTESRVVGIFNATGAEEGLTLGAMLATCREVTGSSARFVWVDDTFLLDRGVQPWGELPLWIPPDDNGIFEVQNDRAVAAGLEFRPLADTVADTLHWDSARPQDEPLRAGISSERERSLIADYATYPAH